MKWVEDEKREKKKRINIIHEYLLILNDRLVIGMNLNFHLHAKIYR